MTSTRQLKHLSFLACCLGGLLLAGCNNSNPYAGQDINGSVLEPSTVNPLDPNQIAATQIALFLNKPVQGLSYRCQDTGNHQSTIQTNTQTQGQGSDSTVTTTPVPVARCGNDASSVSFYLGLNDSQNVAQHQLLGTVYLPMTSPLGTDNNYRNYVDSTTQKAAISNSTFTFNYSLTDMPSSPARISLSGAFDSSGNCNTGKQAACSVVYQAALLMALDANNGQGSVIDIPANANLIMSQSATYASVGFNQTSYASFYTAWSPYVIAVMGSNTLPADSSTVLTGIQTDLAAGASRLQAGSYSLDYGTELRVYSLYYPSSTLVRQMGLGAFSLQFQVYPDGSIMGLGRAAATIGATCTNATTLIDIQNCVLLAMSSTNVVGVYGSNGGPAKLTDTQQLSSVAITSIDNSTTGVALNLFGRFFADYLYDGRIPQVSGVTTSDFTQDYPTANYPLVDSDKGSLTGQFFSLDLPPYPNTGVGTITSNGPNGQSIDPAPMPVRLSMAAPIQLTAFNETALSGLRNRYYRVQLMSLCDGQPSSNCNTPYTGNPTPPFNGNPTIEIGDSSSFNYPTSICLQTATDGTDCATGASLDSATIGEMVRPNQLNGTDNIVNLEFVDGAAPGSMVANLLDDNCQPVKDAQNNPLRVGYVVGTPTDTSVDINLLFVSPDLASQNKVPQFGAQLAGRIDLTDGHIYRMGDTNFTNRLRAKWVDSFQVRASQYVTSLSSPPPTSIDDLTNAERQRLLVMSSGAVQGQWINGTTCAP